MKVSAARECCVWRRRGSEVVLPLWRTAGWLPLRSVMTHGPLSEPNLTHHPANQHCLRKQRKDGVAFVYRRNDTAWEVISFLLCQCLDYASTQVFESEISHRIEYVGRHVSLFFLCDCRNVKWRYMNLWGIWKMEKVTEKVWGNWKCPSWYVTFLG